MKCAFCKTDLALDNQIGRADTCPSCGKFLRCCKQCQFYDPRSYNECREVMADRILDKERSNFCEYFKPRGGEDQREIQVQEAKKKLEALFKK